MSPGHREQLRSQLVNREADAKAGSCLEALWRTYQRYDEATSNVVDAAMRDVEEGQGNAKTDET